MKCQWQGCTEDAMPHSVGSFRLGYPPGEVESDFFLCETHRKVVTKGALTEVSVAVKPERPA